MDYAHASEVPKTCHNSLVRIISGLVTFGLGVLLSFPLSDRLLAVRFGRPPDRSMGELSLEGLGVYLLVFTPVLVLTLAFVRIRLAGVITGSCLLGLACTVAQLYWSDLRGY